MRSSVNKSSEGNETEAKSDERPIIDAASTRNGIRQMATLLLMIEFFAKMKNNYGYKTS